VAALPARSEAVEAVSVFFARRPARASPDTGTRELRAADLVHSSGRRLSARITEAVEAVSVFLARAAHARIPGHRHP